MIKIKLLYLKTIEFLNFFLPKIFGMKGLREFKYFILQIYYGVSKKKRIKFRKLNYWNKINYNRVSIINYAASKYNFNLKYLEIGCDDNIVFNSLAIKKENKFGVDPFKGGNIKTTSDDFFLNNKILFDIIFIDGLHTYSQCQIDILNSLKFLQPNGIIFVHDLIPIDWKTEHCPRIFDHWNGDTWKVCFELIESKNINFNIIDCDNGIGMIQKSPDFEYKKLNKDLKNKKFDFFVENFEKLPIINYVDSLKIIDKKIN